MMAFPPDEIYVLPKLDDRVAVHEKQAKKESVGSGEAYTSKDAARFVEEGACMVALAVEERVELNGA